MTQDQIVEIGKVLLPYLRPDLKPEELGMAAHDAMAAFNRVTPGRQMLVERAATIERERIAKFIESMDDGPLTTKAVKAYLAREIRAINSRKE